MIVLFTDFGRDGPYAGQLHGAIRAVAPTTPIVDLFHAAPRFNVRAAAYLLPAYGSAFGPGSIFVAVVDPGVGSDRGSVALEADGRWYVGPDNGLLAMVVRRARQLRCFDIVWRPRSLSASFHGRDLFAPVAARIRDGDLSGLEPGRLRVTGADWPDDLAEVIYIDEFGNAITGLRGAGIAAHARLEAGGAEVSAARTFSSVPEGGLFWYVNSSGLVEIAANRRSAAAVLGIDIGSPVAVR